MSTPKSGGPGPASLIHLRATESTPRRRYQQVFVFVFQAMVRSGLRWDLSAQTWD